MRVEQLELVVRQVADGLLVEHGQGARDVNLRGEEVQVAGETIGRIKDPQLGTVRK